MQRMIPILLLSICLLAFSPVQPAIAWFFDDNTLVTIDGTSYTADDFKRWWGFYNDKDRLLPKTPDFYIDWLLLRREAKRMDLDSDPGFERQTRIFLQSRGLLMLKQEEVNSKIEVTDAEVKKRYEERLLPRWRVRFMTFKTDDAAKAAWQELSAGKLSVDDLLDRGSEQGGPIATGLNWLRPIGIDPKWTTIFKQLKVGEVADPSLHDHGKDLYYLAEQKGYDEEDFAKYKEDVRKDVWKEKEDRLSLALINKLREKYEVKVDGERLAALDISAPAETLTDEPIITSTRQNFSEREFIVVIRRLMTNRAPLAHVASDMEKTIALKNETVSNIIAQSVTNWECLDRHYEEKEPFKWEYEFNYNYRLVTALETQLFDSEAKKISDEDISQHYEKHINRYTQPTIVKLYIVDETQAPIDRLWAEAAVGKDFKQVLREHFESSIKPHETPANHLDPEVKAVVDKLADGETSQIFNAQGIRVLVHLVEKNPEAPLPLEKVKEAIRRSIWEEKLNQLEKDYLDTLKARSEIKVREGQWEEIQKELGGK